VSYGWTADLELDIEEVQLEVQLELDIEEVQLDVQLELDIEEVQGGAAADYSYDDH